MCLPDHYRPLLRRDRCIEGEHAADYNYFNGDRPLGTDDAPET
jgi:hypothetical protein